MRSRSSSASLTSAIDSHSARPVISPVPSVKLTSDNRIDNANSVYLYSKTVRQTARAQSDPSLRSYRRQSHRIVVLGAKVNAEILIHRANSDVCLWRDCLGAESPNT